MLAFDFDGTLVDSNPIKWRAFERCFTEFPEQREEILAYCCGQHHTPRGDKFRHVYERILKRPYPPEIPAALHARYEAETTQQIIAAPEVPGAERFLREAGRGREIALLSSTPHDVLTEIIDRRRWRAYFRQVQGAPVDKADWLRRARESRGLAPETLLFIGDTEEDAQAAAAAGCAFLGIGAEPRLGGYGPVAHDFLDLLNE